MNTSTLRRLSALICAGLIVLGAVSPASAALLLQISPFPTSYIEGTDFDVMSNSAMGDVTASLVPVGSFVLGPSPVFSESGCGAADFAGFAAGAIALIQRGTCTFEQKAENAAAAGAAGVLVFNRFDSFAAGEDLFGGQLGNDYTGGIPVLSIRFSLGLDLLNLPNVDMRIQVTQADLTVAEPGSLVLLGIALLGLLSARRRG